MMKKGQKKKKVGLVTSALNTKIRPKRIDASLDALFGTKPVKRIGNWATWGRM